MRSQILTKPLPYLALIVAHIIWGANFVVAKVTLNEFPVMSLAFLRFALAFLLLLPFVFTAPKQTRTLKFDHLPRLIAVGIFMTTLNIALFYEGIKLTTAIDASVLSMCIPIISVVACWIFLKEKIFTANLVGIIIGFIGSISVIGLPLLFVSRLDNLNLLGNGLIILSAVSFVAGSIFSEKTVKFYTPLMMTTIIFLVGAVSFFIPAVLEYVKNPTWITHVSLLGLLGFLYITFLSSISAFFLLMWGLARTNIVQANLFHYIEPAVAATIAVPFLGERISFSFIIGTCLIILGSYFGTLGKTHHHLIHHKHHRH